MFPKCYKLPNTLSWFCPAVPAVLPLKQSRASLGSNAAVSLNFEFFLCKKGNSPQTPHVWGLSEITSMLVILDPYFLLPPSLWGSQQIKTWDSTPLPSKKVPFHKSRQSPNKVHFCPSWIIWRESLSYWERLEEPVEEASGGRNTNAFL